MALAQIHLFLFFPSVLFNFAELIIIVANFCLACVVLVFSLLSNGLLHLFPSFQKNPAIQNKPEEADNAALVFE